MIRLLSRYRPGNPVLAAVYWLSLVVAAFVALLGLFFLLDTYFELAPFDQPGV